MNTDKPLISFVIVALNAERVLPDLLGDLIKQTIPHRNLEVILVDSCSSDHTLTIMDQFAGDAPFCVKVLSNPKKWLASGCNIALAAARGSAIIRVDAHARIPADFLEKNLAAMRSGEKIVGGSVLSTPPATPWGAIMRSLDTSRFCGGAAPFRNSGVPRHVDTLAYALYDRSVFDTVGFYNENLRRTEDNEMHYRMRKAGFRFYFSPEIQSTHAARDTLRGQIHQKWGNGYWIGRTMHIEPRCFALRHLIPSLFVFAVAVCILLACTVSVLPLVLLSSVYTAANLYFSVKSAFTASDARMLALLCLPFLFLIIHLVYGTGTILGLLTPEKSHA